MQDIDSLYPFEFAIPGTPLSFQAKDRKNKSAWMHKVSDVAMERQNAVQPLAFLDERPLAVTLLYFPVAPLEGDVDNIVKPILDAMNTILYPDDRLIERVLIQKFEPQIVRVFESPTRQLAAVLDMAPPVVYVRIDDDLDWRTIQ